MDFTTSWIGFIGLLIEVAGLGFLFFELMRSKRADHREQSISAFRKLLEEDALELHIRTHRSFATTVGAMQKLSEMKTDPLTDAVWNAFSANLKEASESLMSTQKLEEMSTRKTVASAETLRSFERMEKEAKRLRGIAAVGIAFVLFGASLQLLDLWVV
ncbi:hypothetical protein [Roseicitreum antarcticum]|uniref:Uncharacterized protein n=1 Tax=Roseicitreum antarcticum TaxID=564137 RepID=A0A1H3E0D9_9RHOB|nr:hypothetical protein [Roseicitreum antarcticum]SDX72163.1 hypothetical protein SAMN04488238_1179 [Roseicitreum antarcticum]